MPHRVTIDTNIRIFQYKILNNVLCLNENFLNSKLFLHLCSFCNSENETLIQLFYPCNEAESLWYKL